jgi:hypothetical protein
MQLENINGEGDLRRWLGAQLKLLAGVNYHWIEPNILLGSTVGAPDIEVGFDNKKIGLELKYLEVKRKGIKWTVRPVQRQYHHSLARRGGRSAILAIVNDKNENTLILVRGDKVPLRDYSSHPQSGCIDGKCDITRILPEIDDKETVLTTLELLFSEEYWDPDHLVGAIPFGGIAR